MKTTKTDRIIISPRTDAERIAITLEYLASFISWSEKLTIEELDSLTKKVQKLVHPSNMQGLNNFLEDCSKYLRSEGSLSPDFDFDGAGIYLELPSQERDDK